METITWQQLGIHGKPIGLLNINHFFDPLLQLVDNAVQEGFIRSSLAKEILLVSPDPKELLHQIMTHTAPEPEVKWMTEEQI